MASSSAPASSRLFYVGGGQNIYNSVQSQAVEHLELCCPNWKNGESHIIPPRFSFKNADIPDAECMEMEEQGIGGENRILIDRWSEEAEHVVFKTIHQLVEEKNHGPFIAIHGSNLEKIQYHLPMVFPAMKWDGLQTNLKECFHEELKKSFGWVFCQLAGFFQTIEEKFQRLVVQNLVNNGLFNWNKLIDIIKKSMPEVPDVCWKQLRSTIGAHFREIDFLLIGPQIGIIIIEVKGSRFSQTKHFKPGIPSLPDNYMDGLKQLETVDLFLDFLQECTGHILPKESIRKVLFTPNLGSDRYEGWLSSLEVDKRNSVKSKVGNVIQLFRNQLSNKDEHRKRPQLYSALLDIFERSNSMDTAVYEIYSPLITTLSCAIIMPDKACAVDWSKLDFSKALADICTTVERQDPSMAPENYFIGPHYLIGPSQMSVVHSAKLIVLTPDQIAALEGPPRQFIFGAAGTGKTIVLQEKALQLFNHGQSVLILAPRNNAERYRQFFESEMIDSGKYAVKYWPNNALLGDLAVQIGTMLKGGRCYPDPELNRISSFIKQEIQHGQEDFKQKYFGWLLKYDNVLIDDAFDSLEQEQQWIECLAILAFMNHVSPRSHVWIATDTFDGEYYKGDMDGMEWKDLLVFSPNLNFVYNIPNDDYYSVSFLNQVMRCPSSVFTAVYHPRLAWIVTCITSAANEVKLSPKIGHKVSGQEIITLPENKESKVEAIKYIWLTLDSVLKRFLLMGIESTQVCIIADSDKLINDLDFAIREENARNGLDTSLVFRAYRNDESNSCQLNISGKAFEIWKWDEISSMEWSIVIFISCYQSRPRSEESRIERYRALSRALARGVEIIATYKIDENDSSSSLRMKRSFQESEQDDEVDDQDCQRNHQDLDPDEFQNTQSIDNETTEFCSMLAEALQSVPEKKMKKLKTMIKTMVVGLVDLVKEDSDSD